MIHAAQMIQCFASISHSEQQQLQQNRGIRLHNRELYAVTLEIKSEEFKLLRFECCVVSSQLIH